MKRWFVSRHPGAIAWAKQENLQIDCWIEHLDPSLVKAGDVVMGTLPLHLAAEVCQRGATFYFLTLDVELPRRGHELGLEEMHQARCSLSPYMVVLLK